MAEGTVFSVILTGTVLPGHERDVVVMQLAALMKRETSFAKALLGGRPATIKDGLEQARANEYLAALTDIGVGVILEPAVARHPSDTTGASKRSLDRTPLPQPAQTARAEEVEAPRVDGVDAKQTVTPSLWNPNAAANWSFFFTPIFGAYLHQWNWLALGNAECARNAGRWLYATIAVYVVSLGWSLYALAVGQVPPALISTSPLIWLFIWYFLAARAQVKVVGEQCPNYVKRGWTIPLVVAFVVTSIFISVLHAAISAAAANGRSLMSHQAQRQPASTFDPTGAVIDPNSVVIDPPAGLKPLDGKLDREQDELAKCNPYAPNFDETNPRCSGVRDARKTN